jgi:hypothetical protein
MPFGFDEGTLLARLDFLQSRADAHSALGNTGREAEYAATLVRDAACVALLLGDRMDYARQLLAEAGWRYLELGVLSGATLLALSNAAENFRQLDGWIRQNLDPAHDEAVGLGDLHLPHLRRSLESPIQLLGLFQARWLMRAAAEAFLADVDPDRQRAMLARSHAEVGSTGLTVAEYLQIADKIFGNGNGNEVEGQIRDARRRLEDTRRAHVSIARSDAYHWQMLLHPADIVDLDAVVLLIGLERRHHLQDANYIDEADDAEQASSAPMSIAHALASTSLRS